MCTALGPRVRGKHHELNLVRAPNRHCLHAGRRSPYSIVHLRCDLRGIKRCHGRKRSETLMKMKNSARREPICKVALAGLSICAAQVTSAADVTIATFNSPAMLELKKLSASFENANRDIKLNWVILEENVLRQRATTDITTN